MRTICSLCRHPVWISSFLLLTVLPSAADTVDARQQLESLLQGQGMVQKERTVIRNVPVEVGGCSERGHCHSWIEHRNQQFIETYNDYLHVTSADVVKVLKIKYEEPVLNSIPPKLHLKSITGKNCTNSKQTINTTLSLSMQTSQTVTWSRTVTTSTSYTLGLTMNQSFSYGGGTTGQTESGSVTFSRSVAITDGKQQSWTDAVNPSEQVIRDVPKMTQVWGSLQVAEGDMAVPFTASVLVDGPVDANDNNIVHVSDVLGEDQRTFLVQGVIHASTASGDIVTFYEKELTASDCVNSNGTFGIEHFEGSSSVLPLLAPTKEAVAMNALVVPPNTVANTAFADVLNANFANFDNPFMGADTHQAALSKMVADGPISASAAADFQAAQHGFVAEGQHVCKSEGGVSYSCRVSGFKYNDCKEATATLKADDCCQKSKVCGPDLKSGGVKCEFGGNSTGFTINSCTR
jgi:hypothetical protein